MMTPAASPILPPGDGSVGDGEESAYGSDMASATGGFEDENQEWIRLTEVAVSSGLAEDQSLVHWASSNSLAPKPDEDIRVRARVLYGASLLTASELDVAVLKMANSSVEKSKSMTAEEIQQNLEDTCGEALKGMVDTIYSAKTPKDLEEVGVTDERYQEVAKGFVEVILPQMQRMINAESTRLSHIGRRDELQELLQIAFSDGGELQDAIKEKQLGYVYLKNPNYIEPAASAEEHRVTKMENIIRFPKGDRTRMQADADRKNKDSAVLLAIHRANVELENKLKADGQEHTQNEESLRSVMEELGKIRTQLSAQQRDKLDARQRVQDTEQPAADLQRWRERLADLDTAIQQTEKLFTDISKSKTMCDTLIKGYESSLEKVGTNRRKIFNTATKEVLPQTSKNTILGDSEKWKNNPFPKELNCANPKKGREIADWAYALCSKYFDEFDLLVPWLWYAANTKDYRCPLRPPRVWSKTDGEPILTYYDDSGEAATGESLLGLSYGYEGELRERYIHQTKALHEHLEKKGLSNNELALLILKSKTAYETGGEKRASTEKRMSHGSPMDGLSCIWYLIHWQEKDIHEKGKAMQTTIHHAFHKFVRGDIHKTCEIVLSMCELMKSYQQQVRWEDTISNITRTLRRRSAERWGKNAEINEYLTIQEGKESNCLDELGDFLLLVQAIEIEGGQASTPPGSEIQQDTAARAVCEAAAETFENDESLNTVKAYFMNTGGSSNQNSSGGVVKHKDWQCIAVGCSKNCSESYKAMFEKIAGFAQNNPIWCIDCLKELSAKVRKNTKPDSPGNGKVFEESRKPFGEDRLPATGVTGGGKGGGRGGDRGGRGRGRGDGRGRGRGGPGRGRGGRASYQTSAYAVQNGPVTNNVNQSDTRHGIYEHEWKLTGFNNKHVYLTTEEVLRREAQSAASTKSSYVHPDRCARLVSARTAALGGKPDEAEPPTGGNQTVANSDREQELAVQLQAERQLRLNTEQEFTDYVGNSSTDSAASQSAVESSQQSTLDKIREQREARTKAIRERDKGQS